MSTRHALAASFVAWVASAQSCTDSATWFKKSSPQKDCAWVSQKTSKRCDVKGYEGLSLVKASEVCQNVCGACEGASACVDADDWYKKGKPAKDCSWVAKYAEKRCDTKGQDGSRAEQGCHAACSGCAETEDLEPPVAVEPGCVSSETWQQHEDEPTQNCAWLTSNSKKLAQRCEFMGVDLTAKDPTAKIVAAVACPAQCAVECGAVFPDEEEDSDEEEDGDEEDEDEDGDEEDSDEEEDGDEEDEDEEEDGDEEDSDEEEDGDEEDSDEEEDGDEEDSDEEEDGDEEDSDEEEDGDEETKNEEEDEEEDGVEEDSDEEEDGDEEDEDEEEDGDEEDEDEEEDGDEEDEDEEEDGDEEDEDEDGDEDKDEDEDEDED